MSVLIMGWVWKHSQAKGNERLVLLAIADHANEDGGDAWPSVATLAAKTRLSDRTVQRSIKTLVGLGELRVVVGAGRNGVNVYEVITEPGRAPKGDNVTPLRQAKPARKTPRQSVTPDNLSPRQDVTPDNLSPRQDDTPRGDKLTPGGVTPVSPGGVTAVSPKPSLEPSLTNLGADERRERDRDDVWDALVAACSINPEQITKAQRGMLNGTVKQLKDVGAKPEEITRRARQYREVFPTAALTPTALAKHWASLGAPSGNGHHSGDWMNAGRQS